jgi:hypothetical protein
MKHSDETRNAAIEMLKRGESYETVSGATGVKRETLRNWKARHITTGETLATPIDAPPEQPEMPPAPVETKPDGVKRFKEAYIGNEPILAFINFSCMIAGVVSATYTGGLVGFLLGFIASAVILDCMEVLRIDGLDTAKDGTAIFWAVETVYCVVHYFSMCRWKNADPFHGESSTLIYCSFVSVAFCVFQIWSLKQTGKKTREIQY